MSWQPQLRSIDSTLYDFFPRYRIHLRALRLIGVGLFEFPVQIGDVLTLLEILCLGNNDISIVPDNIVNLTHLRELSLLYNKLTHLPDRIGYLPSLQKLFLNNNRLAVLPATFGALNLLERVDLECNELTVLPENLASLVSCRSLNLNNNKLLRLPKCIGRMPSLTNLSASCNQLTYIPTEFSCSKTLEVLRLNKNQIKLIPDRIGDMTQLREIALDYNLIERVPVSFRALGNLKILRLEGNSLLEPPKEVVAGGAQFVVEFCRDSYKLNELGRMRQIITATQNILHQIVYYGLADPAYFEPEVQISGDEDPWCALDYPYLWSDAIPKLQQVWSALHRRRNRHRLEQIQQKTNFLLQFGYNEREVAWAYANYSDVYGPVMRRQKAMFRRCACLDSNGNRKPCVPPKVGFMCYSDCTLLKMRLLRTRDKEERVWNSYKAATVRDAVRRAEAESQAYLDSTEGRLWLEEAAYEHAEEVLIEKGTSSVVQKRLERVEDKKLEIIKKFDARKGKIQRVRDDKVSKLEIEINKLKESKAIAKEGYMKGAIERRIHDLTVRLASLPETQQLNDLQIECEDECERVEVALYEDDDSVATSELDSSEYSTDDESDEALRYRRMLQRRRANRIKREEAELARKQLKEETEEKRAAGINLDRTDAGTVDEIVHGLRQTINFAQKTVNRRLLRPYVEPTLEIVNKKVHKLKRKANRRMRIFFEIAKLRTEKIWRKFNGSFDEIQKEMKYEIYHQYINYHVTVAREKAQKEFHVIDQGYTLFFLL